MKKLILFVLITFSTNAFGQSWTWDLGLGITYTSKNTYYTTPSASTVPPGYTRLYEKNVYGFADWNFMVYPKKEFMKLPFLTGHSVSFGFPTSGALVYLSDDGFGGSEFRAHISTGLTFDVNGGLCNNLGKTKQQSIGYFAGIGLGFGTGLSSSFSDGDVKSVSSNATVYEYDFNGQPDYDSYEKFASFGPLLHLGIMFRTPNFFKYIMLGSDNYIGLKWSGQAGLGSKALNYNTLSIFWRKNR